MGFRAVSLSQVQGYNYKAVGKKEVAPALAGKWKQVHASGSGVCCGVSVGRLDPKIGSCVGRVVIPPYCPPPAPPTPDDCRRAPTTSAAIVEALRVAPLIAVQPSTFVHPGWRGRRISLTKEFVVYGTTAGAVAAGIALLAAAGGSVGATALGIVAQQVSGATPAALMSFPIPSSDGAQVESVKFSANATSAAENLFFSVAKSGRLVAEEFQFLASNEVPLEFPASGDDVVSVMIRNPDTTGAWIIRLQVNYWTNPQVTQTDSAYSRTLRADPSWPQQPGCCAPARN